jgi:hypothetical protein
MRKPIFPRIVLLLLLYFTVFTVLVSIQFAKERRFTKRIGNIVVTGQYRRINGDEASIESEPVEPNEFLLEGDLHILFGGMDFCLGKGIAGNPLSFSGDGETRAEALPQQIIIDDNSVQVLFAGEWGLEFTVFNSGGIQELKINGVFSDDCISIELPFKPQRRTGIRDTGNGQFIVLADKTNYSFGLSPIDVERRVLLVEAGGRPVSYRSIPERKGLSMQDFILPQAETDETFNSAVKKWRDENYSLWNRIVSGQTNEDLILALLTEALSKGTLGNAVALVPQSFLGGPSRTYESSVYLGNLDQASRSLILNEREKNTLLSRQINEKSLGFLLENDVFRFFSVRGQTALINAGAELIRTIDPSTLALDIIPGILEGFSAWNSIRAGTENPFERLVNDACQTVSESLRKSDDGGRVFVFYEGKGDSEYNLRLGKALTAYAEIVQNNLWAGIGRSLILSSLFMADAAGTEPSAAKLYRILNPAAVYPRALAIGVASAWAWTSAQTVNATMQNDIMDIAVTFPAGETHYMLIRGIRPFSRVQLYNMDFRTDPQFERYDSSGWSYVSQEQILIVKMKHRSTLENIRIIFREQAPPVIETVPDEDEGSLRDTPGAAGWSP